MLLHVGIAYRFGDQRRSVNLAGCKLWRLLPPQHTHLLYDRFGHELAPGFDADVARPGHFPNLAIARQHVIQITQVTITVVQNAYSSHRTKPH